MMLAATDPAVARGSQTPQLMKYPNHRGAVVVMHVDGTGRETALGRAKRGHSMQQASKYQTCLLEGLSHQTSPSLQDVYHGLATYHFEYEISIASYKDLAFTKEITSTIGTEIL